MKIRLFNSVLIHQGAWSEVVWLDLKVFFVTLICRIYGKEMCDIEEFDESLSYAVNLIIPDIGGDGHTQRVKIGTGARKL